VKQTSENGGEACKGPMRETTSCPEGRECHAVVTCEWTSWSAWGTCSQTCGDGGQHKKTRKLELVKGDEKLMPQRLDEQRDAQFKALQVKTQNIEGRRVQELTLAFAGGCVSFVLLAGVLRLASGAGRGSRIYHRESSSSRYAAVAGRNEEADRSILTVTSVEMPDVDGRPGWRNPLLQDH